MAHRVLIRFPGSSTFVDYTQYVFLPDQTGGTGQSIVGGGGSQSTQQASIIKKWEVNTPPQITFFVGGTLGDIESPTFVPPVTGCLVWVDSTTFPEFFTGYITNEPEVIPIGASEGTVNPAADDPTQRFYGYVCNCIGEETVLDMNLIGFIQPFVDLTVGGIIAALGELLLPGRFNWTNVIPFGPVIPVFSVPPESVFSQVVAGLIANMACKLWYKRGTAYIAHYDENNPAIEPTVTENDPTLALYNPYDLTIKPIPNAIVNDVTGIGDTEAQTYCREYTLGDGVTTNYPLKLPIFGTLGVPIVEDDFSSGGAGSTGTGPGVDNLSQQIWAPFGIEPGDSSDPSGVFQLSGSSLNVIGGLGLGNTMLLMAQGVEVKGVLEIDAGEIQFVDASDAIVGSLCTTETGLLASVKYGWRLTKRATGGTGTVSEHPEGTIDGDNVNFFLSENPILSTLVLTVNGTTQAYGTDFTISVNAITFNTPPPVGANIVANYNYEIGPQTNIQPIVDGAVQGTLLTTKPGFTYSLRLQLSTGVQKTTLPPWYSSGSAFGGGSATAPVTASWLVEEYSQLAVKDPNKYTLLSTTQTGVPDFLFVCELSINDANFAVNFFQVTTPIQGRLFTRLRSDADVKHRTLGYVGDPDADATVTATNEAMTLSFFQQTRPVLRQRNEFRYRSAGPAVARVTDAASIALEALRYGDTGHRKALLTNLNPLPATSQELEWALQAYLDDHDHQQFEGTWMAMTPPYTWSEEPIPGRFINVQCPSRTPEQVTQGVVVGSPPVSGFSELIKVVTITCTAESDDGTLEQFEVLFEYGLVITRQMQKVLAQFALPDPPQVAVLRQISNVPAVDTSLIGTNFIEDAPAMFFYDKDFQNYYLDLGQALLVDEQVELRYSDASWGNPGGANLVGRFNTQQFPIKRKQRDLTVYAKVVRPAGSPGTYLTSRFPAMVRIEYPLIPPQPSGFEVNAGNFQVPSIHFDLPPDTRDIFGILIQDKRTIINSPVTLVSNTVGDIRDMLVVGQDLKGNYMEETVTLNGTTPVTTTKTFYWILWVDSYYGTVLNEIPTPPTNGSATVFTVRDNPVPGTVQVYVDAVAQILGVDYNTTGNTVTFVNPPVNGSEIFISYIFELVPTATVTISAGGTIGVLAPGALEWLANPILYRYEDLSFGGSNNDPALTFNFQNTMQETSHDFFVYFYNLLDELSLPYAPVPTFLQPNQAGTAGASGECPLDVRNFGAIGDGVADDTAAVQAALDQAAANYKVLVAAGLQFSQNETLIGSPPFGGGQPPVGPTGSPGAFGSTIVCIPSGVYCKVFARTPDGSQPCPGSGDGSMNFIINSTGFTALQIDDGVTLDVDGAVILGFNEDFLRYLNLRIFGGFSNVKVPVWIIQNTKAFTGTGHEGPEPLLNPNDNTSPDGNQGDGTTTTWSTFSPFNNTPSGNYSIWINGVLQSPSTYTIHLGATFDVVFNTAPPNLSLVTVAYDYNSGGTTSQQAGSTTYQNSLDTYELGPRNNGIRITGEGFFDCGLTYAPLEMQIAAQYLQVGGILFMKADQSQVDGVTVQHFGHGIGLYWGHSEKISVFEVLFQNGLGDAQSCCDLCSGPYVDLSSNVGIVCDTLRGSAIHNNIAIDVDTFLIEAACFHTDFFNNRAQQCGLPCVGTHLFIDESYFYCWFFTDPFNADGNRKENHYINNRGIIWKPNSLMHWGQQAVPTRYIVGDHMFTAAPCSPANTPTLVGFGTSFGITGPSEPNWANLIGPFFGSDMGVLEPETRAIGAFVYISPPAGTLANFHTIMPFTAVSTTGADLVFYKNGAVMANGVDYSWTRTSGYDQITYLKPLVGGDIITVDMNVQMVWIDAGAPDCSTSCAVPDGPNSPATMQFLGAGGGQGSLLASGIRCIANHISDNYMSGVSFQGLNRPQFSDNMIMRNQGFGIIDLSADPGGCSFMGSVTDAVASASPAAVNNYVEGNTCGEVNIVSAGAILDNPLVAAGGGGGGNDAVSEVPAGTINGSNHVFTLAHTPLAGSLIVFKDGLRTVAFTLAGAVITFSAAPTTSVICDYSY